MKKDKNIGKQNILHCCKAMKKSFNGFDGLQEVMVSLSQNKFRTFMTGFSVAWGIFILIILLASSTGLKNGIMSNFGDRQINTVNIWSRSTSMPYKGLKSNRQIKFSQREAELIRNMPEVDKFSIFCNKSGGTITCKSESATGTIKGVEPDFMYIHGVKLLSGRFINQADIRNMAKVVVIDERVVEKLFNGHSDDVIGKYINVNGLAFKIVGITDKGANWEGVSIHIPLSTHQAIYSPDLKFYDMAFTLKGLDTKEANEAFEKKLRAELSQSLYFDENDQRAVGVWNTMDAYLETVEIINALTAFVLIIGIFTLISGAVGVSNIMLVSVKERTKEFGIRKALGASPRSIISSIIGESLIITIAFGYIGMMLGVGIVELVNNNLNLDGGESHGSIFINPTVELPYVFIATFILIIAGVIAGYVPARKAVRIKPIEAMRNE